MMQVLEQHLEQWLGNRRRTLTENDGVDLALDLQGAVVALEGIDHLFQLCVTDDQALRSFLVLLQGATEAQRGRLRQESERWSKRKGDKQMKRKIRERYRKMDRRV